MEGWWAVGQGVLRLELEFEFRGAGVSGFRLRSIF